HLRWMIRPNRALFSTHMSTRWVGTTGLAAPGERLLEGTAALASIASARARRIAGGPPGRCWKGSITGSSVVVGRSLGSSDLNRAPTAGAYPSDSSTSPSRQPGLHAAGRAV